MEFHYVVFTADKKTVKGTVSAPDERAAAELLDRWGYQVIKLKRFESFMPPWEKMFPSLFKVKLKVLIMFSRQLAMLLESGTDIVTSLGLLEAQQSNRVFKKILKDISTDLRAGNHLMTALGKYPDVFPSIYYRCLSVGEQTGGLEEMLRQVSDYLEREEKLKKGVKGALTYPIIVLVVAVGVVILLVNFVLPAFTGLYKQMGATLPLATKILIDSADFLRSYGIFLLAGLGAGIIGLIFYIRTPRGKYFWDNLNLKLPVIGQINQFRELSYVCRTMAVLFRAGLSLIETMDIVIEGTKNVVVAEALADVRKSMVKGEGLSTPMAKHAVFLPMMVQMVRVGEETGSLDSSLMTVAESYEAETADRTATLVAMIEPAMTMFIGGLVAFIVIAMVSAMYSIYGQMGG
jgi:type IV pilus assembly protein PilC